ncbi:MAG: hypothetical protein OXM58_00660 [Rhodospirillaceae bacterium]|nr:hypothetical protein [Rhodospirillaceae bacterium]MDE0617928.1 hypothetical protein [Rhodospirillaceae bacterium]
MPDWIGWNSTDYVVAEAKGTRDGNNWEKSFWDGYAIPPSLRKAQEQVARVQIDLYHYGAQDVEFKGWAVASRWATEENGLDPWLAAIDPRHGLEPPNPEWFMASAAEMQREILERMIFSFGFSDRAPKFSTKEPRILLSEEFDPRRDYWKQLVLSDGRTVCGLSVAYIRGAFLPINRYEDITFYINSFSEERLLWAATILDLSLNAAEDRKFPEYETEREDSFLSRNGLAIFDLRAVREVHEV